MRLVSYRDSSGRWRGGALVADGVVDLAEALGAPGSISVREALTGDRERLAGAIAAATPRADPEAQLGPPVPDPQKIICLGLNYHDHAREAGLPIPEVPMFFAKFPNSLIGDGEAIRLPAGSHEVDYEAELAIVIGERCKDVAAADALGRIAGLTCFNDVSARDLQFQTSQWGGGKAIDTFAPCGPAIVTLDELPDLGALSVRARVNDRLVQDSSTAEMIFGPAEIVAHLSHLMTLEPGDLIATGTPAGVGYARSPRVLLGPDDVVEIEIEGIGTLRNPVLTAS
jgi:2-keto-4-pentenoate hydratase/2-oxohepta-3-ene-1,7-dioic acid hydratase in catechol pathway